MERRRRKGPVMVRGNLWVRRALTLVVACLVVVGMLHVPVFAEVAEGSGIQPQGMDAVAPFEAGELDGGLQVADAGAESVEVAEDALDASAVVELDDAPEAQTSDGDDSAIEVAEPNAVEPLSTGEDEAADSSQSIALSGEADARSTADEGSATKNAAPGAKAAKTPHVYYRVHRQTYGWESGWKKDGQTSGTTGQSKRLEGIYMKLGNLPVSGTLKYRTHVQTYGWESGWRSSGQLSGTTGQSKRLEAIQIKLSGAMADRYDVWYRVHAQTFGWMGWAKNGRCAGTVGYSKRLEAIQVRLVRKGGPAPGTTANAFRKYVPPAISQSYVGTYSVCYIASHDMGSYAGVIHTGELYSQRTVQVRSISGDRVTFKISFASANTAAGDNTTGWITATVKNGRCDFDYSTNLYGGEWGRGYIKFSDGRITFRLIAEHLTAGFGRQALDMSREETYSKGTHEVWG